jgi:hypothetical protein
MLGWDKASHDAFMKIVRQRRDASNRVLEKSGQREEDEGEEEEEGAEAEQEEEEEKEEAENPLLAALTNIAALELTELTERERQLPPPLPSLPDHLHTFALKEQMLFRLAEEAAKVPRARCAVCQLFDYPCPDCR